MSDIKTTPSQRSFPPCSRPNGFAGREGGDKGEVALILDKTAKLRFNESGIQYNFGCSKTLGVGKSSCCGTYNGYIWAGLAEAVLGEFLYSHRYLE